jgi:hypothetical protein
MKNRLLFLALFLVNCAVAQPVITSSVCSPAAGDVLRFYRCDTNGVSSPGASGAGVVWNFSSIIHTDSGSYNVLNCSATPYCSSFPGSNITLNYLTDYIYFSSTASKLSLIGDTMAGSSFTLFTRPETMVYYPLTYNSVHNDTAQHGGSTFTEWMIDSFSCDAWGSLILPTGTINNVLRVRLRRVFVDSVFGSSMLSRDTSVIYNWYAPGYHWPIVSMDFNRHNPEGVSVYSVVDKFSVGVNDVDVAAEVVLFPNPATGVLNIPNVFDGYEILDLTGRTLLAEKNNGPVDVSRQNPGIYIVRLYREGIIVRVSQFTKM